MTVEVSISLPAEDGPGLSELLKAELPEASVESRDGKVFLVLRQEGDESWSVLRSKVNTALRMAETVRRTAAAVDGSKERKDQDG